jgi:hypothetical protein
MATIKKTIYLHHKVEGDSASFYVGEQDFSILPQYTLLATQEVEFDIGDFDGRQKELEIVEKALEEFRAKSQSQINLLLDRISKLKSIGHDVDADGVPV